MRIITGFLYRHIVKPILFLFPADTVHVFFLKVGKFLGRYYFFKKIIEILWNYKNARLTQHVSGMTFNNPIGLSAGFDYNADLIDILPSVGFGFNTVGTLTKEPYHGNPPPMLDRLPKSKSLLVNKGFKNDSIAKVLPTFSNRVTGHPRGVSIGATNRAYNSFTEMVTNIVQGFKEANTFERFDYFELNISCPNLKNIQNLSNQLTNPSGFLEVLEQLRELSLDRPVFVKLPLERTTKDITDLMRVAVPFTFIHGFIFSNLAKDRTNPHFVKDEIERAGIGNFSGKPLEEQSNTLLRSCYQTYRDRFTFIGVGGVFTAEDAYKKIRYGATLVQLITGMVYMGPQQIGAINKGLTKLLRRDGFTTIQDAVGVDA